MRCCSPKAASSCKAIARKLAAAGLDNKATRLLGSQACGMCPISAASRRSTAAGSLRHRPMPRRDFAQHFHATYGRDPPRLASLGYDAAALAGRIGERQERSTILNRGDPEPQRVQRRRRVVPLYPDGLVQRGLAVLEVEPQGNIVVSPAPRSFRDLGS